MVSQEQQIAATERQLKALQLRRQGVSYAEIAKQIGYKSGSGAHAAVHKALKKTLQEPADDLPVADECDATLTAHGLRPVRITDVGVAGIHRLLARTDELLDADAVIVVAGMEGALASVVGGLTGAPVVAVPTSVGYGSGLEGVTAMLGMLASCANGITVVGIDNGYGAACAVARMFVSPQGERRASGSAADTRTAP